jgi:hypothetical protein
MFLEEAHQSVSSNITFLGTMFYGLLDCMVYTRGPKGDFDAIADMTGESQWTWDNLEFYMKRVRDIAGSR